MDEKARECRRREKERREGRESYMVWWVYERLYTCHLISGALVVLDVLYLDISFFLY